mmetsp:Transcript_3218/g.4848  ORF Transcript_3218/g.4848 Transcript_3218/m.4848 type:complete len:228 (+) Transcript_3218:888-1571(+)
MRKIIAKRLTESKSTCPHFYTAAEIELDEVMKLRKQLATKHEIKISVNDFVMKASGMALRDVPEVNSSYNSKTKEVSVYPTVDVCMAVSTPTGLITPIVPDADKLGMTELNSKIKDLAIRARDGKLKPEEFQGGTFTVSNLGMFGVDEFSAIINSQGGILAVGGGTKQFVPTPYDDTLSLEDQPKPKVRTVMTAKLSADRRVVDEATASLFMQTFQYYMNRPQLLML